MSSVVPHTGRGKWVAILLVGLLLVGVLFWAVGAAFEGRHIRQGAAAMVQTPIGPPAASSTNHK